MKNILITYTFRLKYFIIYVYLYHEIWVHLRTEIVLNQLYFGQYGLFSYEMYMTRKSNPVHNLFTQIWISTQTDRKKLQKICTLLDKIGGKDRHLLYNGEI